MKKMRLDKYLAEMGKGTRSQIRQDIRMGRIRVDGQTAVSAELKVEPGVTQVVYDGEPVAYVQYEYYMLNKPAGVVSATEDRHDVTVLDLIKDRKREDLFPVGRLDKDTEGLLLITNDGALAHRLLHPKKHVDKTYFARLKGPVTDKMVQDFEAGLDIGDEKPTLPAILTVLKNGETAEAEITIREGRFHQVKRMAEAVGSQVLYLKRLRMGSLCLDERLAPGEYRELTQEEIRRLGVGTDG